VNKPTHNPTLKWIFMDFMGVIEVKLNVPGEPERQLTNLNENARKIIAILGGRCENYYAWEKICGKRDTRIKNPIKSALEGYTFWDAVELSEPVARRLSDVFTCMIDFGADSLDERCDPHCEQKTDSWSRILVPQFGQSSFFFSRMLWINWVPHLLQNNDLSSMAWVPHLWQNVGITDHDDNIPLTIHKTFL